MPRLGKACVLEPCVALAVGAVVLAAAPAAAQAPVLPEIRASLNAPVPACVTPERLMRHLRARNGELAPRFGAIARLYRVHGEALAIRWDYAFFQMLLETNYLTFRRGDGQWGDVRPHQNNFAGIGATGGGVPGDSFADISTGVLAQMQHLQAYAGQRVERPVAPRTREKQDDIVQASLALRRPVRFSDLTRRWAADRNYARSIEAIADRYRQEFCQPGGEPSRPWREAGARAPTPPPPAPPGAAATTAPPCDVWSASYAGGSVSLLIRSETGGTLNYTVLEVAPGLEQPQAAAFIARHARNGTAIASFPTRDGALARAFALCPAG
jgi:hypothetical protein